MRVGIVGGGITGLALHHYLSEAGVESVLFEADAEPGGAIESLSLDGRTLELGPQRTRLSPPVGSLVDSLGIGSRVREANDRPLYVYRDGSLRRVPFTLREAVSTDLLSWRGKLRVLLEPLTAPPQGEETVEASIARMAGDEAAEYVVGPLYGGIYGSRPDEMPMEHSLLRALEKRGISRSLLVAAARAKLRGPDPPPVVSFDGGMQTLPRALSEHHRAGIHLDTPVEAVRDAGERFELEADDVTTVDEVVLTTPAAVTGTLLDAVAPEAAAALRQLTYNPLVLVHVEPDRTMDAAGFQVQYDESFHTLGVTCNADLFDRDEHYTCFLGGARTPEMVDWPESAIRDTAVTEFADLTGVDASVLNVQRLPRGMPAYDTSWTAMDRVETPDGVHICANYASRAGVPGRVRRAKALAERLSAAAAATPEPLAAD
jgi:oxygen-dependent protoporphyrinogen oxidase